MKKDNFIFVIGILISTLVMVLSVFLYLQSIKKSGVRNGGIAISTTSPIPTQKPEQQATYKNTEIQVLNASGKKGLAKTYADKLTGLGYTKVTVGNYQGSVDQNLLFSPSDFKEDLEKIGFDNYRFEKSDIVKIIIAK